MAKHWLRADEFNPEYVIRDSEAAAPPKSRMKTCQLSYNLNNGKGPVVPMRSVVVMTPIMRTPFGISTWLPDQHKSVFGLGESPANGTMKPDATAAATTVTSSTASNNEESTAQLKTSVRLAFDDRSAELRDFRLKLERFDNDNVTHIVENSVKWGLGKGGKPLTMDAAHELYNRVVKPASNPQYPPFLEPKITKRHDTGAVICKFVDDSDPPKELTWACLEANSIVRAGVCFSELWFGSNRANGVRQVAEVFRKLDKSAYPVKWTGGSGGEVNLADMPKETTTTSSSPVPVSTSDPMVAESFAVPPAVAAALERKRKAEEEAQ